MSARPRPACRGALALGAALLLSAAACQPPRLPDERTVLPDVISVRTAGHVASVTLEDYVLGSIIAEVSPVNQSAEAVKRIFEVQAVLARTYVAAHLGKHRLEGFDVCDTTHCQLYDPNRLRVSRFAAAARDAVRRTAGMVLTYHGRFAEGLYHADCGGYTASADEVWGGAPVPYLIARPDEMPALAHRQWHLMVPIDQLRVLLNANTRAEVGRTLDRVDVVLQDPGGHVVRIAVAGEHRHELRGEEFRTIVNQALGPRADAKHPVHSDARPVGREVRRHGLWARRGPVPGWRCRPGATRRRARRHPRSLLSGDGGREADGKIRMKIDRFYGFYRFYRFYRFYGAQ